MNSESTILTIDIGNTALKVCVFEGERLIQSSIGCIAEPAQAREAVEAMLVFNSVDGAAYCCVGQEKRELVEMLRTEYGLPVVTLDAETPLPLEICYDTRSTLGADRIAAAVGCMDDTKATLVVDAGTAVTSDVVADRKFLFGNISPGLKLRFRSLHDFTSRLPLVHPEGELPEFGHDTVTALRAGVVNGLLAEIAGDYRKVSEMFDNPRIVLTGGDAPFLAPLLAKRGITAELDAQTVGRGLVRIFNYNNN